MKMTISVGRCLKSKVVKEYINKNFATCKSLCNLQELYTAFKEKHPNVNTGFSKFCAQRPKWRFLGVLQRSSKCCAVCRCNGRRLDILRPDQINFVLPQIFPLKFICNHFYINIIHKSIFLNCNVTSSSYMEMLLISMIKLLFLFFLSDCNV